MAVRRDKRNGHWRYFKRVRLPDGRKLRISGTPEINTKAAAEQAETEHVFRLQHPELAAKPRPEPAKEVPTVEEYIKTYLEAVESKGKPSHWRDTRRSLENFIRPAIGDMRLDEITQAEIDAFARSMKVKAKTVNNRLSALSSMLRYAAKCRLIDPPECSFFVDDVTPRGEEICNVPDADVEAILAAATDERFRVAVLLGRDAGLRAGEIRGLQWGDVDELRREIVVRRAFDPHGNLTAPKSGKARPVPMSEALRAALAGMERRGIWIVSRLDGEALGYSAFNQQMVRLYDLAGVERPAQPIHGLRHSFCTALADAGTPVQVIKELAGHASITTTLKYMHADDSARRAAIASAFGGKQMANKGTPKRRKARGKAPAG